MPERFPSGLYDLLVTDSFKDALREGEAVTRELSAGEPERMAEALALQLSRLLGEIGGDGSERTLRQLELVNALISDLRGRSHSAGLESAAEKLIDTISNPPRVLTCIHGGGVVLEAPEMGLAAPWLFTAGKGSPSLLQEIRHELAACDGVDILVSFITMSGVRKLLDLFQRVTAPGSSGVGQTRIRILTTTYTGATEMRALDELARLPGCEIRISLDGRRTRLHAKAWIFHRKSGFGATYVGSANLSGAALTGGLEWTVKLTQRAQEALFARACAHFETLWEDSEFQAYNPEDSAHRKALGAALERESGEQPNARLTFFDLQPKTYQLEMLEQLANEREHGRSRNLLVAATGTGKTVVAAFDYRATCEKVGGRPRLLFIVHREEILRQALRTYREVLRDGSFGELLAGGTNPECYDHLFATIDSVTSRDLVARFGGDYWHSVVIDECHRLAADRFHAFVSAVKPALLLGLTATPERSDGQPIAPYFDNRPDGSPAVELRLWHALDLQLLAPFEYYGCDDDTDFSDVPWDRAGEREAIDNVVTGNHARARLIVNEWRRLCAQPEQARALVFCVSVAHAQFMTEQLNRAGLSAACVVGTSSDEERRSAPVRLARGEICALVTVDLYNEGIDLPNVDTLLLLRPTQSPVLFQQQIGRGLRLATGKESCLVLDFVGQHRTEFRFDRLLSSLTGLSKRELLDNVEHGFGLLPTGCHLQLQRQTREQVLRSLRSLTSQNWRRLRGELQAYAALRGRLATRLADFLHDQALDLSDIYRGSARSGWTVLKREAGLLQGEPDPEEAYFSRRLGDLLHTDDAVQLDLLKRVGESRGRYEATNPLEATRLQMLTYQVDGQHSQVGSHRELLARLSQHPEICSELEEISDLLQSRNTLPHRSLPGLEEVPLCLHASYGIREILTAVGWLTAERRTPFQAGTLSLHDRRCELLFVTLDKSEGYHDRIAYHDYAISRDCFHWQTQNSAGPDTPGGRRYLESGSNGWQFQLFVRTCKGQPYRACGPVTLLEAEGDRPMSIIWRLQEQLPLGLFQEFSVLRGA